MEEILKEELRSGEKLLWSGKPEAFDILDVTHKKPLISKAIMIMVIVSAVCILYVAYVSANNIDVKLVLVVAAMLFAVMGALSGFNDGRKMKKMNYAVTDQRIIFGIEILKSLEYSQISEVEFKTDVDGHTSVLIGKDAIKAKPHLRRSLCLLDAYIDEDTGFCSRYVLYAVPDAEKLKNILGKYIAL